MSQHESEWAELVAYAAGELEPDARARLHNRLSADPDLRARVERIRAALGALRSDDSAPVPDSLHARLTAIYDPARHRPVSWAERLTRVVASLVHDSRSEAALAGFRSDDADTMLMFESELGDIELQIDPGDSPRERFITGQLTLTSAVTESVAVGLANPGATEPDLDTRADAGGGFSLACRPGTYDLLVRAGAHLIVVPGIEVR